jgi:hypothetical protein
MKKVLTITALSFIRVAPLLAADALPSWNETAPKKAIVAFVEKVFKEVNGVCSARKGKSKR